MMKTRILLIITISMVCFLSKSQNNSWQLHHSSSDMDFRTVVEDKYGNIIVAGGEPNSHFRILNKKTNTWELFNLTEFDIGTDTATENKIIRKIITDTNGRIWAFGNLINPNEIRYDSTYKFFPDYHDFPIDKTGLIVGNNIFQIDIEDNHIFVFKKRADDITIDNKNILRTINSYFDGISWKPLNIDNYCSYNDIYIAKNKNIVYLVGYKTKSVLDKSMAIRRAPSPPTYHTVYFSCLDIIENDTNIVHFDEKDLKTPFKSTFVRELSDGTDILIGQFRNPNRIIIKSYDSINHSWEEIENSNILEYSPLWMYMTLPTNSLSVAFVDHKDNIWITDNIFIEDGDEYEYSSIIIKYCKSSDSWSLYKFPTNQGFPTEIHDLIVDSQNRLWVTGDIGFSSGKGGIFSLQLEDDDCNTINAKTITGIEDIENISTSICRYVNYNQENLQFLDCKEIVNKNYFIYNIMGQYISSGKIQNQKLKIGKLENGIYIIKIGNEKQYQSLKFIVNE